MPEARGASRPGGAGRSASPAPHGGLKALEVYEQDYKTFYPYSSKYDAYLAGKTVLTHQEAHGLQLFNDADKGNCASCHVSAARQ